MKKAVVLLIFVLIFFNSCAHIASKDTYLPCACAYCDFERQNVISGISGVSETVAVPHIYARSYCLMDADSGALLLSNNMNARLPIASTTKIMTAIVAIENSSPDEIVTIDKAAAGTEGSSAYLYAGEKVLMLDLIYALMLQSANDAAAAIAIHISGSIQDFAALMNEKAADLGMKNTHFTNPHGLHNQNHYSSAYDMSLLLSYAIKNELFALVASAKSYRTHPVEKSTERFFSNHNRLLHLSQECIGGKTGYTKNAGRCLASAFRRDGKTLCLMTIDDGNDWNDHLSLAAYGFSLYNDIELLAAEGFKLDIPVVGAATNTSAGNGSDQVAGAHNYITATNLISVTACIRSSSKITFSAEAPHFLYAPVYGIDSFPADALSTAAMHPVGILIINADGYPVAEVPLYARNTALLYIKPSFWHKLFKIKED
ncbi:hypothetical protein SDC9_89050 [bioreactor metagenome]|uniref:Peptidase S11 D-alanyl-D-alanine carboxypeptidase A N-terminal domain-containing protein n=1 Tax=bioreactor metagenome TaxID=1076179 RepID=A0A644ZNA1_9ZZZZ|nr:D-alanyl-D-alanine carboxypeptidase family protein [Oscillospiraceae bacterium]